MKSGYLIDFQHTGNNIVGFLDIAETGKQIPFEVRRVFWTHSVPDGTKRGHHAHKLTEQILIAIKGRIEIYTETPEGSIQQFELTDSSVGLYLPPNVWHTMTYYEDAVQLVFSSTLYDEFDYLRNFDQFKMYYK